jgi:DNA-binding transcriptional LysR family regulator
VGAFRRSRPLESHLQAARPRTKREVTDLAVSVRFCECWWIPDNSVVDVVSARGMDEIAADRLDAVVIASWGAPITPPPHVAVHQLMLDLMLVVLPDDHPLAARQPPGGELRLADLSEESWVTILAGHAAREQFDQAASEAGFTPRVRFQTESYDVAQALVGTGIGVALVSRLALTGVPGTTHRELSPHRPHRRLLVVTRADTTLTPLVDAFLGLLRGVADEITATWSEPPYTAAP